MKNAGLMLALFAAHLLFFPLATMAQGQNTLIGHFQDWSAYSFDDDSGKGCFVSSLPKTAKGNYTRRDPIFAVVTHRPGDKTRNTFSYTAGYTYKNGSEAVLRIDDQEFKLFTDGGTAWATSAETDDAIVAALRKGSTMVVKGVSLRGTETTDTFGLKGSGAALDAIDKACPM